MRLTFTWLFLVGLPIIIYAALRLDPTLDPTWDLPLFHFYIVTFASLLAMVGAVYTFWDIGAGDVQSIFLTLAFAAMAGIFVIHGIATPGVVLAGFNQAVGWSARLSLSVGAVFIVMALLPYTVPQQQLIIRHRYKLWLITAILYAAYVGAIFQYDEPFAQIADYQVVNSGLAVFSIVLLLWGTYCVWRRYQQTRSGLALALMIALPWLALAQVSQYEGLLWRASWWMYHVLMLNAYILAMYSLVMNYERRPDFSLKRYFASLGLAVGVPLSFLLVESLIQLTGRDDQRTEIFALVGAALLLWWGTLFWLVRRGGTILNERTEALRLEKQWRTDMTSLIAHDLKNPLNTILLEIYLVGRHSPAEVQPRIERLHRNAQSMISLIDDMLDIERLEAGVLQLDSGWVDVRQVVQAVVDNAQAVALSRQQQLGLQITPNPLPAIEADQRLIERVMMNLVTNAIKYTPEGGSIHIDVQPHQSGVRVRVSDSGIGIPPEDRERIFDHFAQVRREDQQKGFGLGLAFCKLAVVRHGGSIHVEDSPLGGSAFVVTLPAEHLLEG